MSDKPRYNPDIHHRHSIRLKEYDYSLEGSYFVTICTRNRECLFGKIEGGKLICNDSGKIVLSYWNDLPVHYENVRLDKFVIMPNHFHGIVVIGMDSVGAIHESPFHESPPYESSSQYFSPFPESRQPLIRQRRNMILSKIIGRFKMLSSKHINENRQTPGISVWQRNYYEHIIRDKNELAHIREYIINNPANWDKDEENPEFLEREEE